MLKASMSSVRARAPRPPSWLSSWVVSYLQAISRKASSHPIHTIAFVAILASTTYIGLLETSLFEPPAPTVSLVHGVDAATFYSGSKTLHVGQETGWKWQNSERTADATEQPGSQQHALLTLVFPDTTVHGGSAVPVPERSLFASGLNTSVQRLPCSKNLLSPISQETTLALSLPYEEAGVFISAIQELPAEHSPATDKGEDYRWAMSAMKAGAGGPQRSFKRRASDAWIAFIDLLKNAEELDIIIMVLGYLSMHLTFVSLFMSMRRLGSQFWLGTTVLFSSAFAMLFGLIVTIRLGVPLNMVLLSEGLPFLVVTIGFEKPIVLTRAVLSASLALERPAASVALRRDHGTSGNTVDPSSNVASAVQIAVKEKGFEIVSDYFLEILILIAGAASGVQGGLCQFCFLAAWILFFDCILLFTFYTSILTIKLEINRIKRHVAHRRALEEDGVSRRVAELASNDDWRQLGITDTETPNVSRSAESSIFGMKARDNTISRFKVMMVAGFIGINVLNFCTIPFRSGAKSTGSALSSAVTQPPMDPFKVAGTGLDTILDSAKQHQVSTWVTVLTPIRYELDLASSKYPSSDEAVRSSFDMDFTDQLFDGMGGRMVDSLLKSFEDPILSKWIIIALAMSLFLNGYLFNAARWSIKDSSHLSNQRPLLSRSRSEGTHMRHETPIILEPSRSSTTLSDASESDLTKSSTEAESSHTNKEKRTRAQCELMVREKQAHLLDDDELVELTCRGKLPGYALEKLLDKTRAVKIRRSVVSRNPDTADLTSLVENCELPYKDYDYDRVFGACCENVIGYLPLPLGLAGPLDIDGRSYFLPMATTEGVLVASTSRGAKAINASGGAVTVITGDGMTRGPCVGFNSLTRAGEAKIWIDSDEGSQIIKDAFNSTSRFARLQTLKTALAGQYLYIRFKTTTGDAMGMNMISKGVEKALEVMSLEHGFDDMAIISLSGNYCTDKKPSAINWIDGRGKSVVAEAIIPADVVRNVLKSDVDALVELNTSKNLIGSAMAGSIGGFNAHAANIVAAMFLATGQDPAQTVESCNCITTMKNNNGNLQIAVSLPSIEVGTIGGGTFLGPQAAMLDMLGVRGSHATTPGGHARQLARIIGAGVLAGELSLCSALAAGHLVKAHMQHNRSAVPTPAASAPGTPQLRPRPNISMTNVREGGLGLRTPPTPSSSNMTSLRDGEGRSNGNAR